MTHFKLRFLAAGLLLACAAPAFANSTGGCVNSPENATLILALLGGAVAGLPWLRKHLAAHRARHRDPARFAT